MSFGAQESVQNQVALGGALQSLLLDVFEKYLLFFRHATLCCQAYGGVYRRGRLDSFFLLMNSFFPLMNEFYHQRRRLETRIHANQVPCRFVWFRGSLLLLEFSLKSKNKKLENCYTEKK